MADMTRRKKWHDIQEMGRRIRQARERLDMTQDELAALIGRSRDTISHYETGNRAIVVTELPALAQALRVPIEYFFGYEEPDGETMALVAELNAMPPAQKKDVLDRWRLELEWRKRKTPEQQEIVQEN